MKHIETNGITYIETVPGGTGDWYFGLSFECGDLYEAEEIYKSGRPVEGRDLILIHYPDGTVYRPMEKTAGEYSEAEESAVMTVRYNGRAFDVTALEDELSRKVLKSAASGAQACSVVSDRSPQRAEAGLLSDAHNAASREGCVLLPNV